MKQFASLISLVLLLILAVVVSVRALRDLPASPPPEPRQSRASPPLSASTAPPAVAASTAAPMSPMTPSPEDYVAQMRAAKDYLAFIRAIRPAAEAGDSAAQLTLYRAMEYCRREYRAYFLTRKGWRTLDEALQWSATRWPLDPERAREVYGQCLGFVEADPREFGPADDWLRRAADAGLPEAQAQQAMKMFLAGSSGPGSADSQLPAQAMMLLGTALRSRKAEVVWWAGELTLLREQMTGTPDSHLAWYLAACRRGLDCYAGGDLVRGMCVLDPACQPYESVADLLRRYAGSDFPTVERRADEINALIDAGDWEALGLGAATSAR